MKSMQGWKRWLVLLGLLALATALAWRVSPWGRAQAMVRIGLVPFTVVNDRVVEGFKQAMAERGWEEGRNVEYRSLPGDGQIAALEARLTELLTWKPTLVLAMSTPPSQAAYRVTKASATPLVFAPVSDPLAAGIVSNLARPGEHATGVRLLPSNGVRLELLVSMLPKARKYYVPYTRDDKSALATLVQIEPAARTLGIELLLQPVDSMEDIERAAREIPPQAEAVFLLQDSRIEGKIDLFVAAALARRLPLSAPSALQVEQGALMTFGFEHRSIGRQAARMADSILQGTAPANLPVETAENKLYLNLKTAQAIGLVVEDAVLRQAQVLIR